VRLNRVYARDFGRITEVEVPLGPGLNVLHGPNDLGKSSLVEAIRLALLLPFSSSHAKPWAPGSGAGGRPTVELDFQIDRDHWRVRKEFGSRGKAVLSWSKDGVDWDVQEQARGVDGKLRRILQWGIPEPGGTRGQQGMPDSFLATALLSTQHEVDAVLRATVDEDRDGSARDRIADALSAMAEDPLFSFIFEDVQAKRDEAFTPTGNLRRARDSALVRLGDRVRELREARDAASQKVADSTGVETTLQALIDARGAWQTALDLAAEAAEAAEACVAAERAQAEAVEAVAAARAEVAATDTLAREVARLETVVADRRKAAQASLSTVGAARDRRETARSAMEAVEIRLRAEANTSDALARQAAELRKAEAQRALEQAQAQVEAADRVSALEAAVTAAAAELDAVREKAATADRAAEAAERERAEAALALGQLAELERRLDRLDAEAALERALEAVARRESLQEDKRTAAAALATATAERAAVVVPNSEALRELRALDRDRQVARATLAVGLRVTVTPRWPLELGVVADGESKAPVRLSEPKTVTAEREVTLDLGAVTVEVVGGAADAVARAEALDARWAAEAVPHLQAAGKQAALDRAREQRAAAGPGVPVTEANAALESARTALAQARSELDALAGQEAARQSAQGAELDAAKAALHDAVAALEHAETARSSHLGQALGPGVSARFAQLTDRRYAKLELDAALATSGVRVGHHLRSPDRLSVGTREQLATLYRLARARQLDTVLVLDDQLVQSDGLRMDWFRQLLWDEAAAQQVIVLTCRPLDYLPADGWQGAPIVELGTTLHSRNMEQLLRT
jgi:hypothetical protein